MHTILPAALSATGPRSVQSLPAPMPSSAPDASNHAAAIPDAETVAPRPAEEAGALESAPESALASALSSAPALTRSIALPLIAAIALIFALQWAEKFFIPLIFSIIASYTLTPVIRWMEHIRIPRIVAVSLLLGGLLCAAAGIGNALRPEFQSILVRLPGAAHEIAQRIGKSEDGKLSTMQQIQATATEIEKATTTAAPVAPGVKAAPAPVVVARPAFRLQDWLWAGSMGAIAFAGTASMVVFLIFFLLLSGDSFKRKLVRITGPSLSSKKITVHILDDINHSIQNYMFMLLVTNVLLALMLWLAFRLIGLENAGAWAVAAGCLHIIPYFGPLLIAIATGLNAFIQFGTLSKMFLVSGTSLAVALFVGTFITTWMTGRIAKMNAAAVFISLLFWGWLWGIWGLLLGIPIIVMMRVVCEHIEMLEPLAELLGE